MNINTLKIGVLCGGFSNEREISLRGAKAINEVLISNNIDSKLIDIKNQRDMFDTKTYSHLDFAFVMIHGKGGEDGSLQKILSELKIPFSGSGISGLKNSFDKVLTKEIWLKNKINTPKYATEISSWSDLPNSLKKVSKLVVKPSKEGSSLGVSIIENNPKNLIEAIKHSNEYEGIPIVEEFISGRELTVSILGNLICDPIEIITKEEFYNFEAKYNRTDNSYYFPKLNKNKLKDLKNLAKNAFSLLNCEKWGRVDLIEKENSFYFIEANTVPGMTETSLVPKAAKREGLNFFDLVKKIILDSIDN